MKVIGLTGSIGSGKSTVAGLLAQQGVVVIDADKIGHRLLAEDEEIKEKLVGYFGDSIKDKAGNIDRAALANQVFNRPEGLRLLNRLLHPAIRREIEGLLKRCREKGEDIVLVEAALLVEAGWQDLFDYIWVTTAPEEVILYRLAAKGLNRQEALTRLKTQLGDAERVKFASNVIQTHTGFKDLEHELSQLLQNLKAEGY